MNVELLLGLIALSLIVGIVVALLQVYGNRFLTKLMLRYEWFFREIPELVLPLLTYFGLRRFGINLTPVLCRYPGFGA